MATEEPTITLSLKEFLQILWGYKHQTRDYRDKAYPSDAVIAALESLPKEVADRYFVIQRPRPSVGMVDITVWSKVEWNTTGEKEKLAKEQSAHDNFANDKLADYLVNKFPLMDKRFLRDLSLQINHHKNYAVLATLGVSPEEIEEIKHGSY